MSAAGFRMRDLAGGVQPVPEPETIALAATGILMGGVMIYRDRSRRRRRDGLMVSDELPAAALMPA